MNRVMLKADIRCMIFIFAAICIMMCLAVPAYSADKAIARLTSFSGTVLIKSQGSWGGQPEKDLPLYSDDKIVTKVGIATVTFDDGAVMEIKANSNLLVKETEQTGVARGVGAVKRQVRLFLGKMFFRSGRDTSVNTTLETTTMVCGLRGTAGVLSIDAAGVTYLQFAEGGGDTIGNFIAGVAPDVPVELADLNPVQRAAFVAAAAADQAKQAADRLASGEITDAEAALVAAQAAEAAAEEAKAAAEAMLDNPDPMIQSEAATVIEAAEAAIEEAQAVEQEAVETGALGTESDTGDTDAIGFDVPDDIETTQGNEYDHINTDVTPPVVSFSSAPDPFSSIDNPEFEISVDDAATVSYSVDGGNPIDLDSPYIINLTRLSEGSHEIVIFATDEAGNDTTETYNWVTDYTAPVFETQSAPEEGFYTNTENFTFEFVAGDTNALTYSYSTDGGSTWSAPASTFTAPDFSDGSSSLLVRATDEAGNTVDSSFFSWITDNTSPVFTVQSAPEEGSYTNTENFTIEFTASDTNALTYSYSTDGGSTWSAPASTFTAPDFSDGSSSLIVTVTDEAGNIISSSHSWTTDNTPPVGLTMASKSASPEALSFLLESEDSSPVTYSWNLTNGSDIDVSDEFTGGEPALISGLGSGSYTFTWTATDAAGNMTSGEGTVFDLEQYDFTGNLAGTGSDITGTAVGGASLIVNDNWGGTIIDMNGTWTGTHTGTLDMVAGGGMEDLFWLSKTTGIMDTGTGNATATTDFKMLTSTDLVTGSGIFLGSFATDNTWTGIEMDSGIVNTPLTFGSSFTGEGSGGLYDLFNGTINEGYYNAFTYSTEWYDYDEDGEVDDGELIEISEYMGSFDYEYFQADSYYSFDESGEPVSSESGVILFGIREEEDEYADLNYNYVYLPYGNEGGKGTYIVVDDGFFSGLNYWSIGDLNTDYFLTFPELGYGEEWVYGDSFQEAANILAQSGEFSGMLGGTGDLWTGSDIYLLGTYTPWDDDYNNSMLFNAGISSSDITAGGAYEGFMFGSIASSLNGGLYALYVRDDGTGGVLEGGFDGAIYPDIAMWEAQGTISTVGTPLNTGIMPYDLEASLDYEFIAGRLGGDFGTEGSKIANHAGWGETISIAGNDGWGIFSISYGLGNNVYNPEGSSTWTARTGGMGAFGTVEYGTTSFVDQGYWLTDEMTGTAGDGTFYSEFTGNGLTMTKYFDITGKTIGLYDELDNTWQANSGGYWDNSQDLYFSGAVDGRVGLTQQGELHRIEPVNSDNDSDGYKWCYEGVTDSGWTEYSTETGSVYTYYHSDGSLETTVYSTETGYSSISGTWKEEGDALDLYTYLSNTENWLGADYFPPTGQETVEEYYTSLNSTGDMEGLLGGLDDLWAASESAPADIVLMGDYEMDQDAAGLPSVFSLKTKSENPYDGTGTIWDGADSNIGAYLGFIGGYTLSGTDTVPLSGGILALFIDDSGNTGILRGAFDGSAYLGVGLDDGMWEAYGSLYPTVMGTTAISPETLADNIYITEYNRSDGYYDDYQIAGTRLISLVDYANNTAEDWGIYSDTGYGDLAMLDDLQFVEGFNGPIGAYFDEAGDLNGDSGYYINHVTVTSLADEAIASTGTGNFITNTKMGTLEGAGLGSYNADAGTFQHVSMGTWEGDPLSHISASFNSSIYHGTRYYYGQYDYSGGGEFYYSYYEDNTYGFSSHHPTSSTYPYTYTYYSADGTTYSYGYDADGNYLGETYGTWDPETQNLADIIPVPTPPDGETAEISYTYDDFTTSYTGTMDGLLGGTSSLWSGSDIPMTMMGEYSNNYSGIWLNVLKSYNFLDYTDTTYDGGSYSGDIGGIILENGETDVLEALLAALYIAPDGSAGYLTGSMTGSGYSDIGVFEMDGTVNHTQMTESIGIAPEDLEYNIYIGSGYTGLDGSFTDDTGKIGDGAYGGFKTMAITDQEWGIFSGDLHGTYENPSIATAWTSKFGGEATFGEDFLYNIIDGENYYTGTGTSYISYDYYDDNTYGYIEYYSAGDGDLAEGEYYIYYYSDGTYSGYDYVAETPINGTWDPETQNLGDIIAETTDTEFGTGNWANDYEDISAQYHQRYGYFVSDTSSTWQDSCLSADINGRFITENSMGTITGDILGTYDGETSGDWNAVSMGAWEGDPLSHVSSMYLNISYETKYYYGQYLYSGGGYFYYEYYGDNSYGYFADYPTSSTYPYTYTYYYADGTTYSYGYDADGNYLGETHGTWDPETENLADIIPVPTPPDGETAEIDYVYDYPTTRSLGSIEGLLGGTSSLWTGTDIPITAIGTYQNDNYSGIWSQDVYSYNYLDGTYTTYDSGAYGGYIGGIALENGRTDVLEGLLAALYIAPDGSAGYLNGSMTGSGYSETGIFEMDGTVNRTQMIADAGIEPGNLTGNIITGTGNFVEFSGSFDGATGNISVESSYQEWSNIQGQDWGISLIESYGQYDGTSSDLWSISSSLSAGDYDQWTEIAGTQWSNEKIVADYSGAWINIVDAQTGISGGKLVGTFDPNDLTWQAVAIGSWIETTQFLDMAATAEGRAGLEQLDIPCVQVGVTSLGGEGGAYTVTMTDVEFFAYSTDAAPKIWATGSVTGDVYGDVNSYPTVNMSGQVFDSVDFTVNNYTNETGATWDADVSSTVPGTINGYTVGMLGGAAGTVDAEYVVGTTNGAFSGTAAGVAQEQ